MQGTILLVEDNNDSRAMLRFILEEWGYRVIEAVNGKEAIFLATIKMPDLILMDLSMPEVDGLTATRLIKKIEDRIPVVCLTAHGQLRRDEALDAGCAEIIDKPVDFSELSETISKYLCFV